MGRFWEWGGSPVVQVLFGGTFDPVHLGHVSMCETLAKYFPDSIIRVIPNNLPPHRSAFVHPEDRLAMMQLALSGIERIEISNIELLREAPSYTVKTVEIFRNTFGLTEPLVFALGADALKGMQTWHQLNQLVNLCHICVLDRNGSRSKVPYPLRKMRLVESVTDLGYSSHGAIVQVETPAVPISSTLVREELKVTGRSNLIMPAVMTYIQTNQLYQDLPE